MDEFISFIKFVVVLYLCVLNIYIWFMKIYFCIIFEFMWVIYRYVRYYFKLWFGVCMIFFFKVRYDCIYVGCGLWLIFYIIVDFGWDLVCFV